MVNPLSVEDGRNDSKRIIPPAWLLFAAVPGLAITTGFSIYLLYLTITGNTFTGSFYNTIIGNRATVQIFVQVLSHLLGMIHVFVLTTLFNAFTRKWYQKRSISLDCLKWWNSMCNLQFDLVLSLLPAAFWAGAITPFTTTKDTIWSFEIPKYGADPTGQFWNQTIGSGSPDITRTVLGSFSYAPVRNILGSVLEGASAATALRSTNQLRRKLDNSGYGFNGRSYGVGSSIGLTILPTDGHLQTFTFKQHGYKSDINCWYNNTMDFSVHLAIDYSKAARKTGMDYPNLYLGCGKISNGFGECRIVPGLIDDKEVVVMLGDPYMGYRNWSESKKVCCAESDVLRSRFQTTSL
ncbi:hypothetical protein ACMFMF_011108 [Clarireedia jacksonii]